ncbi:hypothetical protein H4Q26_006953 [Puccinia striiformis f. sp. tritici PST-130]|nr:hypothetical protein H4Q26_006953 [Puccinia striiformis f. sp. tritici PST-130]
MNQYLNQLRVKQFTDLMSGVFLCTLILQYETHSKRYVPEVINFLVLALVKIRPEPLDFTKLFGGRSTTVNGDQEGPTDQDLVDAFDVIISLLNNFSDLYGSLSNLYPEVFSSVLTVLQSIEVRNINLEKTIHPDTNQVELNKLKNLVKKEKKGAIRELRKDNRFLAGAQAHEKKSLIIFIKLRITASLQEERSEEKKQDRLKIRLKKSDKAQRGTPRK